MSKRPGVFSKWPCVFTVVVAAVAIVGIWRPEYFSPALGALWEYRKAILTPIILLLAGLALACLCCCPPRRAQSEKNTDCPCKAEGCGKPDSPYPASPNWKDISGFGYDSDLRVARRRAGLSCRDREAQYIVAERYSVSFDLDHRRRTITVPRGMLSDLASVPRPFRWLVGRVGPHLEASIIHDYLYIAWQRQNLPPDKHMRRFADRLMLIAMNAAGMRCKARLIYWAVRLFGCWAFFDRNPGPLVLCGDQLMQMSAGNANSRRLSIAMRIFCRSVCCRRSRRCRSGRVRRRRRSRLPDPASADRRSGARAILSPCACMSDASPCLRSENKHSAYCRSKAVSKTISDCR